MVSRRPLCCRILFVTAVAAMATGAAGTVADKGQASPGILDEIKAEGSGLGKVNIDCQDIVYGQNLRFEFFPHLKGSLNDRYLVQGYDEI